MCAACMRDTAAEKLEKQLRLRAADYQLTDVSFRSFQVCPSICPAAEEQTSKAPKLYHSCCVRAISSIAPAAALRGLNEQGAAAFLGSCPCIYLSHQASPHMQLVPAQPMTL